MGVIIKYKNLILDFNLCQRAEHKNCQKTFKFNPKKLRLKNTLNLAFTIRLTEDLKLDSGAKGGIDFLAIKCQQKIKIF